MKTRLARLDDAVELALIHAKCFDVPWSPETLRDHIDKDIVVVASAPIAGFIILRDAGPEAEILTLAVAPHLRRQQVATSLWSHIVITGQERGWSGIFLEVSSDNGPAKALYTRLGFRSVGVRRGYYRRPNGVLEDAVVMEYPIDTSANP